MYNSKNATYDINCIEIGNANRVLTDEDLRGGIINNTFLALQMEKFSTEDLINVISKENFHTWSSQCQKVLWDVFRKRDLASLHLKNSWIKNTDIYNFGLQLANLKLEGAIYISDKVFRLLAHVYKNLKILILINTPKLMRFCEYSNVPLEFCSLEYLCLANNPQLVEVRIKCHALRYVDIRNNPSLESQNIEIIFNDLTVIP